VKLTAPTHRSAATGGIYDLRFMISNARPFSMLAKSEIKFDHVFRSYGDFSLPIAVALAILG
jgi:hypothetical protein